MTNQETNREIAPKRRLEEIVSPKHLQMISMASGGFYFREDLSIPPGKVGYTNMKTRLISINPGYLQEMSEASLKGFLYHEAGHHAPDVVSFQNKIAEHLASPSVIPESYRGQPENEKRFANALWVNLGNGLADMWLESYMGRTPYYEVRGAVKALYEEGGLNLPSYQTFSKPEQFIQALLRIRYLGKQEESKNRSLSADIYGELAGKVDSDVLESIDRVYKSQAMAVLLDRGDFENYFATAGQKERAIERKFLSYEQVFLPEYLRLVESEIAQRKGQRPRQKSEAGDGLKMPEPGEPAVPLTEEEEKEILEELLGELEQAGGKHKVDTLSNEEIEAIKKALDKVSDQIDKRSKGEAEQEGQAGEVKEERGLESLIQRAEQTLREGDEARWRGLAESAGVRQNSVESWEKIKERYRLDIESTASALAEIFLDDRRKRLEYLVREGEVVPGLELETISALISGDLDPKTKMKEVRNPEFLETELEFIVDTSGSMEGEKIEKCTDFLVVVAEAFRKVEEDLEAENLLMEAEHPFRVGVTTFKTIPYRVSKLDEPISREKELKIIDEVSKVEGGTDESETVKGVYKELSLGRDNVIKIIIVLTDGHGNRGAVEPIIRQIEEDDQVVFLAVGMGSGKNANDGIVETYLKPLAKEGEKSNVLGISAENLDEVMPQILDFLKREVAKRASFR